MPDLPRALLDQALALQGLSRLELHAGLHRFCQANAQQLRNLLRERAWDERAVGIEQKLGISIAQPDWKTLLAAHSRWGDESHALIFSAALLRALDEHHKAHRSEMGTPIVEIPLELGGGRTLFLPPPPVSIEELIPEKRRLARGAGYFRSDVHQILSLWWHLVPLEGRTIQPKLLTLPAPVSDELGFRLRQGDLRIGVCSPFAALDYLIRTDPARCHEASGGVPYRFAEMAPACLDHGRKLLVKVLDACAHERIDLLCFPELTLDTNLLRELSLLLKVRNETLHPALVMAGSFHVDAGLGRANRCSLLDGFGNLVAVQDKCTPYSMPGAQVLKLQPDFRARLGLDERGGYEDIELSGTFNIIECALGRVATPICLDFCGDQLRNLLEDTQVNLLLVPAMTPRMSPFYSRARDLGTTNRATTLGVNSAWLLRQIGLSSRRHRAFAYLPAKRALKGGGRRISDDLSVFTIREVLGLP
jgi:hypothetical protein